MLMPTSHKSHDQNVCLAGLDRGQTFRSWDLWDVGIMHNCQDMVCFNELQLLLAFSD